MKAATNLIVLSLDRKTFVDILGPLQDIMNKEKSAEVSQSSVSRGIYDNGHSKVLFYSRDDYKFMILLVKLLV